MRLIDAVFILVFFVSFYPVSGNDRLPTPDEAQASYDREDYAAALSMYTLLRDEAAKDEKQRESWGRYAARVVRCQTALGNPEQAAQEYFLLCRLTPPSKTPLDCIPIPWFTPPGEIRVGMRPHEKTALDRLDPLKFKSPGAPATLLAAAVLSVSSDNGRRIRGITLLRNLEAMLVQTESSKSSKFSSDISDQDRQIALLASALLWKQKISNLKSEKDLQPIQNVLSQISEPFRAGPYFLFALAARQVGEHETAVLAWMRLPILYPEDRPLCLESLREAASSLEKLGRSDQAQDLRKELELKKQVR